MIMLSMAVKKGDVLKYVLTPQILPRLRSFYQDGFGRLAHLMALVYNMLGILPSGHEALKRGSRMGVLDVMGAAAASIQFNRRNIDKIAIYILVLAGIVLLAAQFFTTLAYVMINPVLAQEMPKNYGDFFGTPQYDTDIAYRMMFTVFGVPEIFNPGKGLNEFHKALHSLFQFYSIGILVIAVLIVCYLIFAVLAETAQTGVPFGKRFNSSPWTPIRLVIGLGLLIPVGYGLNSAQWITLYSAKFGSDFATTGWIKFNNVMQGEYISNPEERVATPQAPEIMPLVAFMMTVNGCYYAYQNVYKGEKIMLAAYLVKDSTSGAAVPLGSVNDFSRARAYFNNGNIVIRFGEYNATQHANYRGHVYPYCGEVVIKSADTTEPGSLFIQEYYYNLVNELYIGRKNNISQYASNFVKKYIEDPQLRDPQAALPSSDYKKVLADNIYKDFNAKIKEAVQKQASSDTWKKNEEQIKQYGWGGAGAWYNKIAQINGSLVTAVNNIPQVSEKPAVVKFVEKKQLETNNETATPGSASVAGDKAIQFNSDTDRRIADTLRILNDYWSKEELRQDSYGNQVKESNNQLINVVNLIFGTRGLFDMCASANVHPLAQLSNLGKGLIEATIRNLGASLMMGGIGMLGIPFIGAAAGAASSILLSVATITLTMGFMLFYVLPFMPFLYFFFAVGGWIKGLFEAMVGLPLWALAFLRFEGDGLPGDSAMDGIYLIFEVFLRPIIIVFGLLASVIIFAAMVKILNDVFSLVVMNLSGHDPGATAVCGKMNAAAPGSPTTGGGNAPGTISYFRGPIDELFFTVIYAIVVYMIGISCFKLIDLVPNNILRYMGVSVSTFSDKQDDPAQNLMRNMAASTTLVSGQVFGGVIGGASGALSNTMKGVGEMAKKE